MKVIDMQLPQVRNAVLDGKDSPIDIYLSNLSMEYNVQGIGGLGL